MPRGGSPPSWNSHSHPNKPITSSGGTVVSAQLFLLRAAVVRLSVAPTRQMLPSMLLTPGDKMLPLRHTAQWG